ncbi:MAG: hypothetical protein WDW38_000282 [Sanguina aurantia]
MMLLQPARASEDSGSSNTGPAPAPRSDEEARSPPRQQQAGRAAPPTARAGAPRSAASLLGGSTANQDASAGDDNSNSSSRSEERSSEPRERQEQPASREAGSSYVRDRYGSSSSSSSSSGSAYTQRYDSRQDSRDRDRGSSSSFGTGNNSSRYGGGRGGGYNNSNSGSNMYGGGVSNRRTFGSTFSSGKSKAQENRDKYKEGGRKTRGYDDGIIVISSPNAFQSLADEGYVGLPGIGSSTDSGSSRNKASTRSSDEADDSEYESLGDASAGLAGTGGYAVTEAAEAEPGDRADLNGSSFWETAGGTPAGSSGGQQDGEMGLEGLDEDEEDEEEEDEDGEDEFQDPSAVHATPSTTTLPTPAHLHPPPTIPSAVNHPAVAGTSPFPATPPPAAHPPPQVTDTQAHPGFLRSSDQALRNAPPMGSPADSVTSSHTRPAASRASRRPALWKQADGSRARPPPFAVNDPAVVETPDQQRLRQLLSSPTPLPWYMSPDVAVAALGGGSSKPPAAKAVFVRAARAERSAGGEAPSVAAAPAAAVGEGAAAGSSGGASSGGATKPKVQSTGGGGSLYRGLQATAPLPAGALLMVSLPLAILTRPEGSTPENEELADLMLPPAGSGSGSGSSSAQEAGSSADPQPAAGPGPLDPDAGDEVVYGGGGGGGSSGGGSSGGGVELFGGLTEAQQRVLLQLDDGDAAAARHTQLPTREELQACASGEGPRSPITLAPALFTRLVNLNCSGEEFTDLAVTGLRGEDPLSHVALWPEPAFANHSCSPNATAYTVGDRLVVVATQQIPQGGEITLSYLGSRLTLPLSVRRAELRQVYGFKCKCSRCTLEAKYSAIDNFGTFLDATYSACSDASGRLQAAINVLDDDKEEEDEEGEQEEDEESEDQQSRPRRRASIYASAPTMTPAGARAVVWKVQGELEAIRADFETRLTAVLQRRGGGGAPKQATPAGSTPAAPTPAVTAGGSAGPKKGSSAGGKVDMQAKRWLQASVYDMYDLLSLCADEQMSEDVGAVVSRLSSGMNPRATNPNMRSAPGFVNRSGGDARGGGGAGTAKSQVNPDGLETELLAVCSRLLAAVAPSSDSHTHLCGEYMLRAKAKFGQRHEESKQARVACEVAYQTRYGGLLRVAPALDPPTGATSAIDSLVDGLMAGREVVGAAGLVEAGAGAAGVAEGAPEASAVSEALMERLVAVRLAMEGRD